jgi:PhzF family phenazine biosynthesis protein
MQTLPIYQVDAFTNKRFCGNPAAVVPLMSWISDELMQAIALENNLAETAYFVRRDDGSYDLRWFTPELEIPLCGHATLASAFVLFEYLGFTGEVLRFHTKSGELTVSQHNGKLALNFPARPLVSLPPAQDAALRSTLKNVLGKEPKELYHSVNNYFAVFEEEADIRSMQPNITLLNEIPDVVGVIVSAKSHASNADFDCISRYFCPQAGIPEDPVTGSAHCTIVPYWAQHLGKNTLKAYQASARGGELFCEFLPNSSGDRVFMAGDVVPYMKGEITV